MLANITFVTVSIDFVCCVLVGVLLAVRLREYGSTIKELDLIDEQPLNGDQLRTVVSLL